MMLDAIIIAGGDPEKDADLLAYTGSTLRKALIELGGRTFLERIIAAMQGSGRVRRIVVVGIPLELCPHLGPDVVFLPDTGSMLGNGEAGVAYLRSTGEISDRLVVSSSDIPLVTPQVISSVIDQCLAYDVDFCYTIVEESVMEQAFPGSGRTFVPMEGKRYAGGDMNMARATILDANRAKIDQIIGARKTFWRQVRAVGLDTLLLFLIRRLTIAQIERRVKKALGVTGKAVICPHAEIAMDVDKPHHWDVVRAAFERQQREGGIG